MSPDEDNFSKLARLLLALTKDTTEVMHILADISPPDVSFLYGLTRRHPIAYHLLPSAFPHGVGCGLVSVEERVISVMRVSDILISI